MVLKQSAAGVVLADALIVRLPVSAGNPTLFTADMPLTFVRVARDKVVQRGRATIAELPRARDTVLLFPAEDVLILERAVPPLNERRLRAALPALVEDATFTDINNLHVAASHDANGKRLLAVVDRALFKRWLDLFERNDRLVARAWCESLCLPYQADSFTLALRPDGKTATLRTSRADILTIDAASNDKALLQLASQRHPGLTEVVLYGERAALAPVEALLKELQLTARRGGADALSAYIEGDELPAVDLLQGEFARGMSMSSVRAWQSVAALMVLALVIETLGLAWRQGQLSAEKTHMVAEQSAILKRTFPATTTVLDAPTQMRRALDALEQHRGQSSAQDFETLLTHAGTLLGTLPPNSCGEMHFDSDALSLHLKAPTLANSTVQAGLIKSAQAMGNSASFIATGSDGDLTMRLSPKAAP
jgi:general secretion pathway protein L